MHTYELSTHEDLNTFISAAACAQEPIVISDKGNECLVAMNPSVFERILFGTVVLNSVDRTSLHL